MTAIDSTLGLAGAAAESAERARRAVTEKSIGYRVILGHGDQLYELDPFIELMPCVLYPLTEKAYPPCSVVSALIGLWGIVGVSTAAKNNATCSKPKRKRL